MTSINDLPRQQQQQQMCAPQMAVTSQEINQMMPALVEASQMGYTKMPTFADPRHSTMPRMTDGEANPNYIQPPQQPTQYIEQQHVPIQHEVKPQPMTIDEFVRDYYMPLACVILFYLFQLQSFKQLLNNYIPWTQSDDGNLNNNGLVISSMLFGVCIFTITKLYY